MQKQCVFRSANIALLLLFHVSHGINTGQGRRKVSLHLPIVSTSGSKVLKLRAKYFLICTDAVLAPFCLNRILLPP